MDYNTEHDTDVSAAWWFVAGIFESFPAWNPLIEKSNI